MPTKTDLMSGLGVETEEQLVQRAWGRDQWFTGWCVGCGHGGRDLCPKEGGSLGGRWEPWRRLGKRQSWQGHVDTVWRWPERGETLRHPVDKAQEGAPLKPPLPQTHILHCGRPEEDATVTGGAAGAHPCDAGKRLPESRLMDNQMVNRVPWWQKR